MLFTEDTRLDEWIRTSLLLPIDSKVASTTADVNTEMSLSDISKKKRRAENNGTAKVHRVHLGGLIVGKVGY